MRQVVPLLLTLSAAAPSFAAICGTNFGSSTTGLTVTVGVMAVDVLFVSPTQIEAELPFGLATGPATLTVAAGAASSDAFNVTISAVSPFFSTGFVGPGALTGS